VALAIAMPWGFGEGMPVYLVLVIAVAMALTRAKRRIEQVEGVGGQAVVAPPRAVRWRQAGGMEKAAFVVMAVAALVWFLLILTIGFAAAVIALGLAVWKRPYLEATLAPVVLIGGATIVLVDLGLSLAQGDGGWGAAVLNAAVFGGVWVIIGVLLWAAGRSSSEALPTSRRSRSGVPE
jgi:uncharacterized membrane protein YgcG